MPPLPDHLTFSAWQRSRLFDRALPQGPRLGGTLSLTLTDTNTAQTAMEETHFTLMAAADVGGLKPSAIKHVAPAPFARDAETTKLAHVDLWEPDLPWRYTPAANAPQLAPWLVLLVGTADELQVAGGLVTRVADSVLAAHNLVESYRWAHTQWDGHTTIGRITSPRGLELSGGRPVGLLPQHEYLAVLVPAFNDEGQPMWRAPAERHFGKSGALPAFHSWRFWTADAGDFETLAAALHLPPAHDVGKAQLRYRRQVPDAGVNIDATLEVRGAITSLQQPETPQPAQIQAVQSDLDALNDEQENTIGLPHYGRPWLSKPDGFEAGWPQELNDDPRFRGTTGLGVWMGVQAQEALMDAAVAQAGALRDAGQRINHLALGLLAGARLWDRRMPTDPNERLRLLGPLMTRMVASDGGRVIERVTTGNSPISPALFSSAAQRILRERSGPTRHLAAGLDRSGALDAANQPPPPPDRAPAGLPHVDAVTRALGWPSVEELLELDEALLDEAMRRLEEIIQRYLWEYASRRDELVQAGAIEQLNDLRRELAEPFFFELMERLQAWLAAHDLPCEAEGVAAQVSQRVGMALQAFCQRVLAEAGAQRQLRDELRRGVRRCMTRRRCLDLRENRPESDLWCDDLLDNLPPKPQPEQQPIDLGRLSDALVAALDPRRADAPARVRLCSQLVGIDCSRLIPPEFAIGLDFPTWGLLKQYDREWLLPGASTVEKDSITALQTNPTFIDGFMVGINSQFMSEMRWRDLAVTRTCTPLRMFWGQVNYATQQREADIAPLAEWAKAPHEPLGALSHQSIAPHDAGNASGSRLVILFRSDLFRRYPATLVYLVKPAPDEDVDALLTSPPQLDRPDGMAVEQWRAARKFFGPIFAGTLTPELTFFTFDVTPSELNQYWLVLDEPPTELRFRNDQPTVTIDGATFAKSALDQPTRVAISGVDLQRQGLNP